MHKASCALSREIRLGVEATPEYVAAEEPCAVIVAVGGREAYPDIPGANGPNVVNIMGAYDHPEKVGDHVVMAGGGLTGCGAGMSLGKTGRSVSIACRRERLLYHEEFMPFFNPVPLFYGGVRLL